MHSFTSNTSNDLYPLLAELFVVSPVLYNGVPRKLSVTISMYSWGEKQQKMAIKNVQVTFSLSNNSSLYQEKIAQDTVDLKLKE